MQAIKPERQTRVKSAERVLDIIEALSKELRGLSFTELQRILALPKSSLHELLNILTARGYLEYDGFSRKYMLGIRVWESGQAYLRHHDLVREALPVMQGIVHTVNETAQLAILDGVENVYLAKVDSSHALRLQSEVGRRLYAHATGLGKVLLAHLTYEELLARLPDAQLPRFTSNTITTKTDLFEELAKIGERGFAVDLQEYTPGVSCVAVPICQSPGRAVAAMSVSVPITRASIELFASALALLAEGSLRLARRLGSAVDDPRLAPLTQQSTAYDAVRPLFRNLVEQLPADRPAA